MGAGTNNTTALCYLARGADEDWRNALTRFISSHQKYSPGLDHTLYIIFKGFQNNTDLSWALALFRDIEHVACHVDDDEFDIGAYRETGAKIAEQTVCFLNTTCEIICENWLAKLAVNLAQPGVGLVGATGSFESLHSYNSVFPKFPNPHLRTNAFMINRERFCSIAQDFDFEEKLNAFLFESGPRSLTRRLLDRGLKVLVVGRNGRGYPPLWWPHSGTFRQGAQPNVLVADNQTRKFDALIWREKREFSLRAWGIYLQESSLLNRKFRRQLESSNG
jgi:hypothetical protein